MRISTYMAKELNPRVDTTVFFEGKPVGKIIAVIPVEDGGCCAGKDKVRIDMEIDNKSQVARDFLNMSMNYGSHIKNKIDFKES